MLTKFESGELNAEQYRQFRLSRGIYGQRQDGFHMVRVKIPQGIISALQLRVLADSADKWSRGYGHLTTRQNIQFHEVKPESVAPMLTVIAESGLTTREACSHTVRNVVGCPYAGVCATEPFDVTPYAEAITRFFLRGKYGSGLPRKFKITASGCNDDCAKAAINDIGIVAKIENGRRGFRFLVGGGTATLPRSAQPLFEFIDADELLAACEAVTRVYNREGERKNLQKARLKWAIKNLGWEGFVTACLVELDLIRAEGGRPLPELTAEELAPTQQPEAHNDGRPLPVGFAQWKEKNVRPQSQAGWSAATTWLRLGDVSSSQMRALADLCERLSDGTVRTTLQQNLLFRWVRNDRLPELWRALEALGLHEPLSDTIADVTSCPGAETCRIAVTASRGMAQLLGDGLKEKGADRGIAANTDIKISGCPNGCGQHHVAAIGLQGGVRRIGASLVPEYMLTLGGGVSANGAAFGRFIAKLPARRVPTAVDRLIELYASDRAENEDPRAFFARVDVAKAKTLLADLTVIDEKTATENDYIDLGSTVAFQVELLDSECAT